MTAHRILHVFRTPLGGLFRHVLDVARGQAERGHEVGILCDSTTGGARSDAALAELAPHLVLGVTRFAMHRNPHASDLGALAQVYRACARLKPDVIHGHGSKGGLYARLMPASLGIRAYTPHGGSFNYAPGTLLHRLYMMAERGLARRTDIFLFESDYIRRAFERYVGPTERPVRVVRNGISRSELEPVALQPDPFDLLYIGELRPIKGIDTLVEAVGRIRRERQVRLTLLIVGSGPEEAALKAQVQAAGIWDSTSFVPPQPIRSALAQGRLMVVPSRGESLPYVVLEAAGAAKPLVSTDVGGIPEIFGPYAEDLIPPDDVEALMLAMLDRIGEREERRNERAAALSRYVADQFSIDVLVDGVIAGYGAAARAGTVPDRVLSLP